MTRRSVCKPGAGLGLALLLATAPLNAQERALAPGIGFGGSLGLNGFGGTSNSEIARGIGWELHASLATRRGLYIRGGVSLSGHDLEGESAPWQYRSFYLEPRWFVLSFSPRLAPFIAGRAGYVSERVPGRTWELKSTGRTLAGGGGVTFRVAPQIALEAGVLLGVSSFGAYDFVGEFAWKACLDGLDTGTPLPASVSQCAGSRSVGNVVNLCYPPYFPERTSNCSPPEIPYEGTSRSGTWVRTWIGVSFSLSSSD